MQKRNDVDITPMQKRAVDNILSGKYPSSGAAMRAAGYSKTSSQNPKAIIKKRIGVQKYLQQIDIEARKKTGNGLRDTIFNVYFEGLSATKLFGKNAIEHPDYAVRKQYADKFSEFFGWNEQTIPVKNKNIQVNFFATPKKEQEEFNSKFVKFVREQLINN